MNMQISSCGKILAAFLLVWSVLFTGLGAAGAQTDTESLPSPGVSVEDALVLQEIAMRDVSKVEAKVTKLNAEQRSALRKKVGQLAYYASRSQGFVEAKMSMIVFNYPDAFIWQNLLIFARYAVVYPAMVSTGTSWLIPYIEPLPIELGMTMPYIWMRNLIGRKIFQVRVGVDPELLKTLLFQDLDVDLKTTNFHVLGRGLRGENSWLLPVHQGKDESPWVSRDELEALVNAKDPEFIRQLKLLQLDGEDYVNALKIKIEDDPELSTPFLEKAKKLAIDVSSLPEERKAVMDFFVETQDVFNRIRRDSGRSVPELKLLNPLSYIPWFRGLLSKTWLAFKLNRFRSFQNLTLGKYYIMRKTDPRAARAFLDSAAAEVEGRRALLVTGVDNLKERFASYLDLEHEHAEPLVGAQCRALF